MKPVIGIVVCGFIKERQFVSQPYIHAIERAGGVPIILPCVSGYARNTLHPCYPSFLGICDGFLFCGGDDITPLLFGEEPLDSSGLTDLRTDLFQISFMEYLLQTKRPILGICRGMQILNIAAGGTIHQDLSLRNESHRNESCISHMQHSEKRSDISHRVLFAKDSLLYKIFGDYTYTNSFHHQAVNRPGQHMTVAGITSDRSIEAIESTCLPFAIGVQWHPECMYDSSRKMRNLFLHFITAAASACHESQTP